MVNPPIYDFAAFDFWLKPLGLLYLSSIAKKNKIEVILLDCLDRFDKFFPDTKVDKYGRGKFYSRIIEKPEILKNVPRNFKRYGLPEREIERRIRSIMPDIVFVTATMTYWYLGAVEILNTVKKIDKMIPVFLGGVYPSLTEKHASTLGFDEVIPINKLDRLKEILGLRMPSKFVNYPLPDYSHYKKLRYVVTTTSLGCPFRCTYCASYILHSKLDQKPVDAVIDEVLWYYKTGMKDIAFYDDALLYPPERFLAIFEGLLKKNVKMRFHTPNGLHARFIDGEIAKVMIKAKFIEPRISLETINKKILRQTGNKLTPGDFERAVKSLVNAGYTNEEIIAYTMYGIPGQTVQDVVDTFNLLKGMGLKIYLSEFSPVPGTIYYSLSDPLLSNNSAYLYYVGKGDKLEKLKRMKNSINEGLENN